MPSAVIDGIATRYEMVGAGPPLLMYAPGGFNAVVEAWSTLGSYAKIKLLDHLPQHFTCIMFDRRECGQSGGRVERVTWAHYVAQGRGLLDHLRISRAHLMGGCMGCAPVAAFAVAHPEMVVEHGAVLAGRRRQISHIEPPALCRASRFRAQRRAGRRRRARRARTASRSAPIRAAGRGLRSSSATRPSPPPMPRARCDDYIRICEGMRDALFDRDTAPGAEPEDLMRTEIPALIVPGHDAAHATSAARYLEECLPRSDYWDVPVEGQTEAATNSRVLEFLHKIIA